MSPAEVLRAAAAKVRAGWTQGEFARDAHGCGVGSTAPDAVCWCALGAINSVTNLGENGSLREARIALDDHIGSAIDNWNDAPGRTAEEVASAMERAAASLDGAP